LTAPIAFGLVRPTVGVPLDFGTRYDPNKQEAMLAHELAHLAAGDPCWCLLADAVTALLWWHPASWWLRRELHASSELAADEASQVVADGPRALAECLVELGGRLASRPVAGLLRVSGFRSHLGQRIEHLVRLEGDAWRPPRRRGAGCVRIFGPIAMAAVVVFCSAWAAPQALRKGNGMKTMQQNWKQSLAAVALLATLGSPGTPAVAAEREQPAAKAAVPPPAIAPAAEAVKESQRRAQLEAKLKQIVLPEVNFDGLPLSEVVKYLSDECRKRDPEKQGVNFLLNPWPLNPQPSGPGPAAAPIDPTTGLPLAPSAPEEPVDVNQIGVKFTLPLRNVTLKDTLDAIAMMADRNIEYTIEDYAVVFSLKPKMMPAPGPVAEELLVRTYKVDTNTFFAGLESAFGIKRELAPKGDSSSRSGRVQSALRDLLTQLGISMTPGKSIFYNDLTGVVMVRGTPEDQDIVGAAMQTLGGEPVGSYGGDFGQRLAGQARR